VSFIKVHLFIYAELDDDNNRDQSALLMYSLVLTIISHWLVWYLWPKTCNEFALNYQEPKTQRWSPHYFTN